MIWTGQEVQQLRELYPKYSLAELEILFKRSRFAISRKAMEIGARKKYVKKPRYKKQKKQKYEICLHLSTMQFIVSASSGTEAHQGAINRLEKILQNRKKLRDMIIASKSTIKKIDSDDKN